MKNKKKEPMATMTKFLLTLFIFIVLFVITNTIIFCIKGEIPDTLVEAVFTAAFGELSATGLIKIFKTISFKSKNPEKLCEEVANDFEKFEVDYMDENDEEADSVEEIEFG